MATLLRNPDRGKMRFDLAEASGALGDLGTFIPLTVSLVVVCNLDLGSILFFAGIIGIVAGFLFNQPAPLQPMKAIAAVAIAGALSPGSIAAAGIGVGAVLFLLGITGLVEVIDRWVPRSVVRGIQLGVGLKLLIKGISLVDGGAWLSIDGWLLAAVAAAVVLLATGSQKFPTALVLFVAGLLLLLLVRPEVFNGLSLGWAGPRLVIPTPNEWQQGLLQGTLAQMPLTVLNSVIAVCALSADFFPKRPIGTRPMALHLGLLNLISCWFGAMPMCHGAGGLAAQYRFGARSGGSLVMLGGAMVLIAVTLGSTAVGLLAAYPAGILAVLLAFAGAELALPARKCKGADEFLPAVITAGGCLAVNTAVGFAMGLLAALLIGLARRRG